MTDMTIFEPPNGPLKMSSREIAELLNPDKPRHDNVKVTIERLVERGTIVQPAMQDEPGVDSMGRPRPVKVYLLDKRSSLIVVAQLSPEFTARVVDRWQELESGLAHNAAAALSNPVTLRHLLLENVEKVLALEGQVEEMRPQVQALERIAVADGSICITDAAKTLQARPKDLFSTLRSKGWIYRRAGTDHDVAYQSKLAVGFLEHKTTTIVRSDGTEKVTTQVRVTPKGLVKLAELLNAPLH